ncbi:alpha/beta fold hydrolase [Sphingobium sp. H39-3-25]|uniref:esterase/lipase family protein n=1 Tax=Sphingobium arseniciresistens TaxID=3030834 RepID=UPI0023B927B2|nr:alpha/beta fold hydrolase [Sphingobium arseniciresistens]
MASAPALSIRAQISAAPPPAALLAREIGAFAYTRYMAAFGRAVPLPLANRPTPVVVIPGFMASDKTTARMRRSLRQAGFPVHGWGLGRNQGVDATLLQRLDAHVDSLGLTEPAVVVGWSLGGLIAREYAKYRPGRVARVITLGSPFSGDPRANNAWRAYERIAGHPVDCPPINCDLGEKPPVETIACWSPRDGVVAPLSARGRRHERDRALELDCSHMAFVAAPGAIRTVASLIAN